MSEDDAVYSITRLPLRMLGDRRGKCHYPTNVWKKVKGRKEYICEACGGVIQKGEVHVGQIGMIRTGYHSSYDIMIARRHERCGIPIQDRMQKSVDTGIDKDRSESGLKKEVKI